MRSELDCIACAVKQMLDTVRIASGDQAKHKEVLHAVLQYLIKADWNRSPADLSSELYHLVYKMTGNPDPYKDIKRQQNETALGLLPEMRRMVNESQNKLHTAAKLAVVGNIIDCGIRRDHNIVEELNAGMQLPMAVDDFDEFRRMFDRASLLFYACDNAGEIVFDRIFIEQMKQERPEIEIIACVRGGAILNDATREDAEFVGLDRVARVVDTGVAAIGIPLSQINDKLKHLINRSDIIISKGQGNFETLDEITDGRVFFILRAKCPMIAEKFNVRLNDIVFKHYKPR
ncbi:DUF89 family protein [Candidatus Sumerlaeota bacterium]|nr:DUF89 family protein [Candidatus Sumerlaeota bacterium]